MLDLVCESWLGPGYRMTAQVNVVHPGGAAQRPHRDYHLGFLTDEEAARYPIPMHRASVFLTLQGAVSHSDMPVESGPTRLLPFSHQYELGFMAYRDPPSTSTSPTTSCSYPSPAETASSSTTRSSTPRATTARAMSCAWPTWSRCPRRSASRWRRSTPRHHLPACYPQLVRLHEEQGFSAEVEALMTIAAEGYPFPANIDVTPPIGGLAPPSQLDLLRQALVEQWPAGRLESTLAEYVTDRRATSAHPCRWSATNPNLSAEMTACAILADGLGACQH